MFGVYLYKNVPRSFSRSQSRIFAAIAARICARLAASGFANVNTQLVFRQKAQTAFFIPKRIARRARFFYKAAVQQFWGSILFNDTLFSAVRKILLRFFIFPTHRIKKCKVAFAEFVGK